VIARKHLLGPFSEWPTIHPERVGRRFPQPRILGAWIATELGDQDLLAINTMNLGNVCRDRGELDEALRKYDIASLLAGRIHRRETEAKCARLSSAVYLQKNQVELAIQYASAGRRRAAGGPN
jgi:hypothetical protein